MAMRLACLGTAVFGGMLCMMATLAERSAPVGMALIGAGVLGGSIAHMGDMRRRGPVPMRRLLFEMTIASMALMMLIAGALRA